MLSTARIVSMLLATSVALLACALPAFASAAGATSAVSATYGAPPSAVASSVVSLPATRGAYALEFTLPTYGKAGCLVCHGDGNLVVSSGQGNRSFWIDPKKYAEGAHKATLCTGCHLDYGYKAPHKAPTDFRVTAKQSCKGCHAAQFRDYSAGAHAVRPASGGKPDPKAGRKPMCGDCHGGHDIQLLTTGTVAPAARAAMHGTGERMCGRSGCHPDYWANYEDYYHGKAYKRGASDAPACWDCHGAHAVRRSDEKLSPTNPANLGETCGKQGCHEGANGNYVAYVEMIHGRQKITGSNPVYAMITGIFHAIGGLFGR